MTPAFTPGADAVSAWRAGLEAGTQPVLYPVAGPDSPLAGLEIGPGLVTLFGGPPASGKTALVTQLAFDALALTPDLRALVCNVEMPPAALFDRQFARLSGIDLATVRHRRLTPAHAGRRAAGLAAVEAVAGRLAFVRPPFSTDNVARSANDFGADLLVLDYVQRVAPPGDHAHRKASVDAVMEAVRGWAHCGVAVVAVAAVGRQKDDRGRSGYAGLGLASFRESSELEYGADDPFILTRDAPDDPAAVTLLHVKSRHGATADIPLRFDGPAQRFEPAGLPAADLTAAVRGAWAGKGGEW